VHIKILMTLCIKTIWCPVDSC